MHYNGADTYLFVNDKEIIKFKVKVSEIVANPLCLGHILDDVSVAIWLHCIKCECIVSMISQERKIRSGIIDINSNKTTFYPYSIKISKCSGSCNNVNDPYAKL